MNQIAPGVFAIDGLKTGRSYIVEGPNDLALVDTSSSGVAGRILKAITGMGRVPENLRLIVATHYHFDHVGNVTELVESTGAKFHAHVDDAPYIEGRSPWMASPAPFAWLDRFAPRQFSVRIDALLRGGETLPFAGGLRVVHAPGHTPGHIALYAKEHRVLFMGDAVMNTGGLRLPLSMSTHDIEAAKRSVRELAELDFDIALPGHGTPILGQANEKIGEWAKVWL